MSEPAAIPRRAVVSWVLYDLANTVFSMGVISLFFPHYVERAVTAERADAVLGVIASISYGLIFVLSPLLGAMTDRARRRMPFLVWSTLLCVAATALLPHGPFAMAALLFIAANATYQAGLQFYDALLVEVTTEENRGRISGLGVGIGYVGSFVAVGLSFAFGPESFRQLFPAVAAAFLLFAIPCFLFVRERGNPNPRPIFGLKVIRESTTETIRTLRSGRAYPGLLRFLVGRIFYTDAINTVIGFMALFTINVAVADGYDSTGAARQRDFVMLTAITLAVPAGLVWGRVVDRAGPKRTLAGVLRLWMGTFALAAVVGFLELPIGAVYVVACLVGIALAGTWSADRPFMLRLTPRHRIGEFYGLYGMVGRFSAITGPVIWAGVTYLLVQRSGLPVLTGEAAAILVLLLMIGAGYWILQPVGDERRAWSAPETDGAPAPRETIV
jgi:UMF1 family MFS transporter